MKITFTIDCRRMNVNCKTLIVESELIIVRSIKKRLTEWGSHDHIVVKNLQNAIHHLSSTEEISLIALNFDLIKNGITTDTLDQLHQKFQVPFVFYTAYKAHIDLTDPEVCFIRPVDKETIVDIMSATHHKSQNNGSIIIKDGNVRVKVNSNDILYLESENNYLNLVTNKKKYLIRSSIEKFLEKLSDPNFVRIHRSYAVNILKVGAVNGKYVLIDQEKCPLSRTHKREVLHRFLETDRRGLV